MKKRICLLAAAIAGVLSGCGDNPNKAVNAAPGGPPRILKASNSCDASLNPQSGNISVCPSIVVYRTATAGLAAVDPDEIVMPAKAHNLRIYWQLPTGCVFDTDIDKNDGVAFKKDVDMTQFSQLVVTNENGHGGGSGNSGPKKEKRGQRFHLLNANDPSTSGLSYAYSVQFHCEGSTDPWKADPTIKNQ